MSRNKKKFKDLSPRQQLAALISIGISLAIVGAAERDLQHRPEDEIRGDKRLWRLVCLNALGAVAYLAWGRRA
jgi:hypothetical protein